MDSAKTARACASPVGTAYIVRWKRVQMPVQVMDSAESAFTVNGSAVVTMAGMERIAVFLLNKIVTTDEIMTKVLQLVSTSSNS